MTSGVLDISKYYHEAAGGLEAAHRTWEFTLGIAECLHYIPARLWDPNPPQRPFLPLLCSEARPRSPRAHKHCRSTDWQTELSTIHPPVLEPIWFLRRKFHFLQEREEANL